MSAIRLNERHRELIRKTLLDNKFTERDTKLVSRQKALALRVYNHAFTVKERSAMLALPTGWLPMVKTIKARLGANDFGSDLPDAVGALPVPHEKLAYHESTNFLLSLKPDHDLSVEAEAIDKERHAIRTERDALYREINAVLFSATTSNRLIEAWPEIRKLVESICKAQSNANLPAPRVTYLNKVLDLKPVKGEAVSV